MLIRHCEEPKATGLVDLRSPAARFARNDGLAQKRAFRQEASEEERYNALFDRKLGSGPFHSSAKSSTTVERSVFGSALRSVFGSALRSFSGARFAAVGCSS